jgi:hypothetical protein
LALLGDGPVNLLWIYDIPDWASFLLVVGATLAVGWIGLFGLRSWVSRLHDEHNHNEVVSYFLAAVVLFYGVMVGLIAVGVWEQFSSTDEKVALEASSLAALYRDVSEFPQPHRARLQADVRGYTLYVIRTSWPLQRRGIIPSQTNQILWKIQADMMSFQPTMNSENNIQIEALHAYNALVELRRMRLHSVESGLPLAVWVVVVLGGAITLCVGCFFETRSFAVHFWMISLTSCLIGIIIWLLAMLDHPFLGEVSIGPAPFENVYETIMTSGH